MFVALTAIVALTVSVAKIVSVATHALIVLTAKRARIVVSVITAPIAMTRYVGLGGLIMYQIKLGQDGRKYAVFANEGEAEKGFDASKFEPGIHCFGDCNNAYRLREEDGHK